eukprot:CAMPEP_0185740610 /NCGR_PEP_ID=MMETSP1171-20130828/38193_1 /TAXON_ID=374046 /ORGANISM="Helicotheca tamensis, Strain CCMP826" /LENGTH=236 /DNA_ID=CAMNT_0028412501 /DNA_START=59 /DNA_END=766 /DNA_ORIENTATION=+
MTSTTLAKAEPVFPWFFKGMNTFSRRVFGVDIVPASLLGDKKSMRNEATIHDKTVKAVGLNGYKESLSDDDDNSGEVQTSGSGRRITFAKTGSLDDSVVEDRRAGLKKQRSSSCGDLIRMDRSIGPTTETTSLKKPLNIIQRLRQKSADVSSECEENDENKPPLSMNGSGCSDLPICTFIDTGGGPSSTRGESYAASEESGSIRPQDFDEEEEEEEEDDYNYCNTCKKRYKIGKRW